jgi:hypothetical protein
MESRAKSSAKPARASTSALATATRTLLTIALPGE